MTDRAYRKIPIFMYEHERAIVTETPMHREIAGEGITTCPRTVRITCREYGKDVYIRVTAVCDSCQAYMTYLVDYERPDSRTY